MRITAKVDYAVRACIELAGAEEGPHGRPVPTKGPMLAKAQGIPPKFLEGILLELKHSSLIGSQRGAEGGYWLARPPAEITVADIIRAVEGPLADVRGIRPDELGYDGDLEALQRMWVAVRANLRSVLEKTTIADLASGKLPRSVDKLADAPDAWEVR